MSEVDDKYDLYFFQLTFSLHSAAMQQMGKMVSGLTGEIERNLPMAKNSIDMLNMLKEKTAGNLNDDEQKLIDHYLYELRMNYVDEAKKGETKPESAPKPDQASPETPPEKTDEGEPSSGTEG